MKKPRAEKAPPTRFGTAPHDITLQNTLIASRPYDTTVTDPR